MKKVVRIISVKVLGMALMSTLLFMAAGCEKIYDSEGDCSVTYELQFTQRKNVLGADAFAERVKSVSLFVFDKNGKLILTKTDSGEALASGKYVMELKDTEISAGTYDVIAWCGLNEGEAFSLAGGDKPVSKQDLICRLNHTYDGDDAVSQRKLNDLFHGKTEITIPTHVYGRYRIEQPIDLTKNTNKLSVILQHYNGKELDEKDFHFTVTDDNGVMNHDNSILPYKDIQYREHSKKAALVTSPVMSRADEVASISSVVAEIDMARLMSDHKPTLTIDVDTKDKPVLTLPLIDMLKTAMDENGDIQNYLDCQDKYTLIFYLDDAYGWYTKHGIWINGWHVILENKDL